MPHSSTEAAPVPDTVTGAAAAFAALPHELLPLSARVDFLHLLGLEKPAVRTNVREQAMPALRRWCVRYGYGWNADEEGYCSVASSMGLARFVLEVDRRVEPHEMELGLLLGYPRCCCEAIARVGESRIDARAAVVAKWPFQGRFRLIDPSGYRQGSSLICHLPCRADCVASLEIAERALRFLRPRLVQLAFASWKRWAAMP
jgi:hypothetical protein